MSANDVVVIIGVVAVVATFFYMVKTGDGKSVAGFVLSAGALACGL